MLVKRGVSLRQAWSNGDKLAFFDRLTEQHDVQWQSILQQHNHGPPMPEVINVWKNVAEGFGD